MLKNGLKCFFIICIFRLFEIETVIGPDCSCWKKNRDYKMLLKKYHFSSFSLQGIAGVTLHSQ